MPKCPNCGRETARTEDWACQWCGYPLLSNSYKKVPKTYEQVIEEKLPKQKPPIREEPEPAPEPKPEPAPEPKPEPAPEPKPEPAPEPKPEPAPAAMEITAEELLSAYEADVVTAHEKFANKILKVTGTVDRIVINNINNNYYITLASAETDGKWDVQCTFDKKHVPELNRLTTGQTVTVQGKYAGYVTSILIKNCVLVS